MNQSDETDEVPKITEPLIESPDDIIREISRRRMLAEYSADIPPERIRLLIESPDQLEKPDEFQAAAATESFTPTETTLGWSKDLESPAHVRRGDVPREVATMVHEDLHRMTDPVTMREMSSSKPLNELYEGITEYFSERAVEDLHGHVPGECYPEQAELAKTLAEEAGDESLRAYYFRHELTDDLKKALNRIKTQ
jgi:hypothetical protein